MMYFRTHRHFDPMVQFVHLKAKDICAIEAKCLVQTTHVQLFKSSQRYSAEEQEN
jgi:hypothetical protein